MAGGGHNSIAPLHRSSLNREHRRMVNWQDIVLLMQHDRIIFGWRSIARWIKRGSCSRSAPLLGRGHLKGTGRSQKQDRWRFHWPKTGSTPGQSITQIVCEMRKDDVHKEGVEAGYFLGCLKNNEMAEMSRSLSSRPKSINLEEHDLWRNGHGGTFYVG